MSDTRTIIETRELVKIYGEGDASVTALDGVSLKIHKGEFVAFMGPSGSGKSTLLHILGCLARPTSGTYILDGEDVSHLDKNQLAVIRNRKIGFVFQNYNLLPRTDALRNVLLPLLYDRKQSRTMEECEDKAGKLLKRVGLGDRMDHQPQELSGGQQQRVAIARALINDPVMIIADEPTGNLDTHSGQEILKLLMSLHEQGATIIIVTHGTEIAAYTQDIYHLRDGKIETIVHNGKHARQRTAQKVVAK
jgi:putative ABC transport system ATP-binding protein